MANELKVEGKLVMKSSDPFTLPKAASDPGSAVEGDMYYNLSSGKIRIYSMGAWADASTTGSGVFVETFTLDSTAISSRSVTLSRSPSIPSSTQLDVAGGIPQTYGLDFSVSGSIVSWASTFLDGVLEVGDKLVIQYS